jgi:hypothetical protein
MKIAWKLFTNTVGVVISIRKSVMFVAGREHLVPPDSGVAIARIEKNP